MVFLFMLVCLLNSFHLQLIFICVQAPRHGLHVSWISSCSRSFDKKTQFTENCNFLTMLNDIKLTHFLYYIRDRCLFLYHFASSSHAYEKEKRRTIAFSCQYSPTQISAEKVSILCVRRKRKHFITFKETKRSQHAYVITIISYQ